MCPLLGLGQVVTAVDVGRSSYEPAYERIILDIRHLHERLSLRWRAADGQQALKWRSAALVESQIGRRWRKGVCANETTSTYGPWWRKFDLRRRSDEGASKSANRVFTRIRRKSVQGANMAASVLGLGWRRIINEGKIEEREIFLIERRSKRLVSASWIRLDVITTKQIVIARVVAQKRVVAKETILARRVVMETTIVGRTAETLFQPRI